LDDARTINSRGAASPRGVACPSRACRSVVGRKLCVLMMWTQA
jgi:hypothetical protein